MDFDSVEDKVQRDGRNGEDEAENTFPLKTRGNKRPGIPFELSPQLSSSVRTFGASGCNLQTKRFRKSVTPHNLWANCSSSRTADRISIPPDVSAFDMSDTAVALSEVSSMSKKQVSVGCPSISSGVNDSSSLLSSTTHEEMQQHRSPGEEMADPASYDLNTTIVPKGPTLETVFYEDHRSDIRWDFSSNVICPQLYANDIYDTMRNLERSTRLKRDFLARQREIGEADRARIIDWMSHYHNYYGLKLETLHLAVSLLDRLLCVVKFPRSKAEPIAAVALMLASKLEDLEPLNVVNLVENVISYKVDKRAVMHIEQSALYHLNYRTQVPTAYSFANYFNMVAESDALQIEVVNFLLELALRVAIFAENAPSEVALTALLVARGILHRDFSPRWLYTRIPHCAIRFEDVETNMSILFSVFERSSTFAPDVCKEYSKKEHLDVAALRLAVAQF